jgi:hypothetical protein
MFQAAMYFSMQPVMQVVSPLDREVPGLGTHFSKQVSWSFCTEDPALVFVGV